MSDSRLKAIRVALATVIGGATGINRAEAYPPTSIKDNGTAWPDRINGGVKKGFDHELHLMSVMVLVVANRNAQLGEALEVSESVLDAVMDELRSHQNLGGQVSAVEIEGYEEVPVAVGGQVYVGVQINVTITQKVLATYSP